MLNRLAACAAPAAFVVLAATLAHVNGVPASEALWVAMAVAVAFVPSALVAPAGWKRRAAELSLLMVALPFTMFRDPAMRQMMLPPLLVIASWAAVWAALDRCPSKWRPLLLASLGLAARAATGLGFTGHPVTVILLVLVICAAVPAAAARWGGRWLGFSATLIALVPLQDSPLLAAIILAAAFLIALLPPSTWLRGRKLAAWSPAVGAAALVASALAPWGGLGPGQLFAAAGWWLVPVVVLALIMAPRMPPAGAGLLFVVVAMLLGPAVMAPPDRGGMSLAERWPERSLPAGAGGSYVVDLALSVAKNLPTGTPVATLDWADQQLVFRAGEHAVEWAVERPVSTPVVAHELPATAMRRPVEARGRRFWRVSGRTEVEVAAGVVPVIRRMPSLPPQVKVVIATAGPPRITAPRSWPFTRFLWATVLVVGLLQLTSGSWRLPVAALSWVLLTAGAVIVRLPVEPLRVLVERYGVDLCLLALVGGWVPSALMWWRRRRVLPAVAGLLLPLALATPQLTPPLYGDEPFHLVVMDSLNHDADLDLSDDVDLEDHPYQRLFMVDGALFHSPVLGFILLPGYVVGGRTGALVLLALAAALTAALVLRRAESLGLHSSRSGYLLAAMVFSYPLATFATQVWPEMVGALLAVAGLLMVAARPARPWQAAAAALLATAVKTRLALITMPIAAVAWARPGRRGLGMAVVAAVSALGLGFGWWVMGHPFGYFRRLHHLIPSDLRQPVTVLGGLIFDCAGGLLFSVPLVLVAAAGACRLWRNGGAGERALMVGGGLTVVALLPSGEWYGGGSPPARYLVALLPLAGLAAAQVLTAPMRWRRLAAVLLPPTLLSWWVLISRPHMSINPGDGGWWLADAVARRFQAEARLFFPSFLVPNTATLWVPIVITGLLLLWWLACRRPVVVRSLARVSVALWLLAATALVAAVSSRLDTVVQIEAPQVRHRGGQPVPPAGTFSRYSRRMGWLVKSGDEVSVPVNLPPDVELRLHGQLFGAARDGAAFEVRWDDGEMHWQRVRGRARDGSVVLPSPPSPGRHRLSLKLRVRHGGAAILDRLEVRPAAKDPVSRD